MFECTLLGIILVLTIVKFSKNRTLFSKLNAKEWMQYIVVVLTSIAICISIVIAGKGYVSNLNIGVSVIIINIVFVLIGLIVAGFIMKKFLPEKVKSFYL
ncbi:MAG: hypothetical protein ABS944_03225 [Solibacillus sp.]|jgi:protein-S-isoprenylcysteine O-methyltransferase Ste14|uniref:hypothetical protein n=1 Tax=unclassified Solibacillus TaxID=2637870 RepID=UPI0030F7C824